MSAFIDWLEARRGEDPRIRADLKRSLAFEPAAYVPAFRWVEPFLQGDCSPWRRKAHYLVAGLWALHGEQEGSRVGLGVAVARHQNQSNSSSTEGRFIALLDADEDQLPHRLRQMVSLLKEQSLDFGALLEGILRWRNDSKWTQNDWARDFYRTLHTQDGSMAEPTPAEEAL
jgi:CRISPR system Cascade subunit CasB